MGAALSTYVFCNNKSQNLNLSPNQIMSVIEKSDPSEQNDNGWIIPMFLFLFNKDQNLNLSSEQVFTIIKKIDQTKLNNTFVETFFLSLNKQIIISEKHIYKITKLFKDIKDITPENQEKINQILLHHEIEQNTPVKHKTKTIKL